MNNNSRLGSKNRLSKAKTLKEAFKRYKKDISPGSINDVEYTKYRNICEDFNKIISEKILNSAKELVLPYRLGTIRIKKTKMNYSDKNKLKIDYATSNKINKKVYHLNDHTDGFKFRWYWEKKKVIVRWKKAYCFEPTRYNKRTLAKLLKDENKTVDYFE